VVEHLPSKLAALNSNPSTEEKQTKKKSEDSIALASNKLKNCQNTNVFPT
jgi:hypothetical protein